MFLSINVQAGFSAFQLELIGVSHSC